MGAAQQQHAQPGLSNAAAHGIGQLAAQQRLVEGQGAAVVAAGGRKLAVQAFGVDADAHGGHLVGALERGVPEQQVAVHGPVVIVRGAAVVGLSGTQGRADLAQEGGGMLPDESVSRSLGERSG